MNCTMKDTVARISYVRNDHIELELKPYFCWRQMKEANMFNV